MLPSLDCQYLQDTLPRLLLTPSPVGDTQRGAALCLQLLCELGDLSVHITRTRTNAPTWTLWRRQRR